MVGRWYNNAAIMVERNNHGHAILLWLAQNSRLRVLRGHDDKPGWLSSSLGKILLYNIAADALRNAEIVLHDFVTTTQLHAIESATLLAPRGEHDDAADAFALACCGRSQALTWSFDAIGGAGKRGESRWRVPE